MNQYVDVPVPEAHLGEILSHLASLLSKSQPAWPEHSETATTAVAVQQESRWDDTAWRNILRDVTPNARAVVQALAARPGERLSVDDLAHSIGTPTRAVQDALSSLTKRMKKYGKTKWPFALHQDRRTGRYSYEMDDATAATVNRILGDENE
jgi:hypothetical protein